MADRGKQPVVSGQKADSGPPDDPTIANQVATAKQGIEALQPQQHFQNTANNSMAMAAAQMPALALEHNIDLSVPANLIAKPIPMMQSRMISNTSVQSPSAQQPPIQQASSPHEANESSPHGNTSSDASGQSDSAKARHSVSAPNVSSMNNSSNIPSQRSSPQPISSANNGVQGTLPPSQGSSATESQQSSLGFDKQQLHVLKAQILAFRRIRKGDSSLPLDILRAIGLPPPVTETQPKHFETSEKGKQILSEDEETTDHTNREVEGIVSFHTPDVNLPIHATGMKEPASTLPLHEAEQHVIGSSSKSEPEVVRGAQNLHTNNDDKGKAFVS